MDNQWMTTGNVAKETGHSTKWVLDKIKRGQLTTQTYTGGERNSYRILRSDFEAFMQTHVERTND